jgi:hypothetical protein
MVCGSHSKEEDKVKMANSINAKSLLELNFLCATLLLAISNYDRRLGKAQSADS